MPEITSRLSTALAFILAVLFVPPRVEAQTSIFNYDTEAPIGFQERGRETVEGVLVRDISYTSPKGGDVTAYLVVPAGEGPFGGVVFLHWGQGDRTEFLSESLLLARAGAVSLMIDAPFNRRGYERFPFWIEAEKERDFYVQLVVDLRRAVDVLLSLGLVDADRLGYVGHSLGATWGGALAAVEKRIGAFVLMGGLPRVTGRGDTPFMQAMTARLTDEQIQHHAEIVSSINPERLVGDAAPSSVFFQFAHHDRYISENDAKAYAEAASEPKEVKWYFTSHEFNDQDSMRDRLHWIAQRLQLDLSVLPR